ncbi:hypothetical protein A2U01_0054143, partial [Trifolium medium]|nr:hypothetical protein [Trifolium medium]
MDQWLFQDWVVMAELWGACEGLKIAWELGYRKVCRSVDVHMEVAESRVGFSDTTYIL